MRKSEKYIYQKIRKSENTPQKKKIARNKQNEFQCSVEED